MHMASKPRSSDGCWTCRLRRKKCDEVRPLCDACSTLEIDCLYSDEKPEWMDGGERQRDKAEWLKLEVKRKAETRRERRYFQTLEIESGIEGLDVSSQALDISQADDSDLSMAHDQPSTAPGRFRATPAASSSPSFVPRRQDSIFEADGHRNVAYSPLALPTPDSSAGNTTASSPPSSGGMSFVWSQIDEHEVNMIMLYLDYVFPFLFPFYRPPLLHAGRGWLLSLLTRNKALLHTALSVASYFFSVVFNHTSDNHTGEDHTTCRTAIWDELQRQQDLALKELQREMHDIVMRGVKGYLPETSRVLASIIQLLTFEVAVANTGNWMMHLDAATELYNEILTHHGMTDTNMACFTKVLVQLGPEPHIHSSQHHPWSSDQSSLRFLSAYLIFFDTLASTALEKAPRLQKWHQHLLGDQEESQQSTAQNERQYGRPHIDMLDFVGLQNWVVVSIGEIAALDAWKKESKMNGSLSMRQLVERASAIEQQVRKNMLKIDISIIKPPCPDASHPLDPLVLYTHRAGLVPTEITQAAAGQTYIWGQAALTYLNVVVSGWQPANPEIRGSVDLTVSMLMSLPTPSCLRTCVWPFTITGCMATPDQEDHFRHLVAAMGPLRVFGTINESLAIMERVWANRAEIEQNADKWDLAACFRSLGHPSLLV
ncbi:fungal-specific transcription factor domain-containing protein [Podospora appendiculata]|uniref:Fungal-specific transcription factor domain-containing protein n=1 Tax=Podospora appendiculata TaxID=314037 RepID=A0AAE0XJE0_9PEZI|nr:fungal-specific transcription factor domain-containing protein [Podospora appendiculata]